MLSEVTLALNQATGNERLVRVDSKRFTIGRSTDNDLAIDNSSLSRRHAVIENFDGVIQLSDCGSQNGTRVNGAGVIGGAVLHDGDIITLGDVCDLVVRIGRQGEQDTGRNVSSDAQGEVSPGVNAFSPAAAGHDLRPASRRAQGHSPSDTWFTVPVIAACGIVLILLVSGLLVVMSRSSSREAGTQRGARAGMPANENPQVSNPAVTDQRADVGNGKEARGESTGLPPDELIEKAAMQVMHRVSSDDKAYGFSEKALRDIQQKVQEYRTSSGLPPTLASLQRNSSALAAQARREGIEPGLLIYAALAQTDGGRTGMDPVATARAILPDLLALHATFGINDSDSSLILVAAYKMGKGEKRSHPLLATMRHLVKNPLTQRNVWYLNDKGGLDRRSYDFVLSFLALGVISQNPRQFGVSSDPLSF